SDVCSSDRRIGKERIWVGSVRLPVDQALGGRLDDGSLPPRHEHADGPDRGGGHLPSDAIRGDSERGVDFGTAEEGTVVEPRDLADGGTGKNGRQILEGSAPSGESLRHLHCGGGDQIGTGDRKR